LVECGDPKSAHWMHEEFFRRHDGVLAGPERAEALYRIGESARQSGDLDAAVPPLQQAVSIDPSTPRPYHALAKVYDAKQEGEAAIAARQSRRELAVGSEALDLLLEIGDIAFAKLSDRQAALKAYGEALQQRPQDRKLLTRLMLLYTEEEQWK